MTDRREMRRRLSEEPWGDQAGAGAGIGDLLEIFRIFQKGQIARRRFVERCDIRDDICEPHARTGLRAYAEGRRG